MSEYTREVLKVVIAKLCQTIGWHSIHSTPLDILVDILGRYLTELTRLTHTYATQFGHVQPNLDELGLAFRDMHINIADLEEYIQYVESAPPFDIPLYPVAKESHLNFLKPGSNEVVTRPVHIHEHLPPMLPEMEECDLALVPVKKEENVSLSPPSRETPIATLVFKRPIDVSPSMDVMSPCKRPRLLMEEEGRPTREISSVMMTTSGFLSPAREGKLPEARTPVSTMANDPLLSSSHNLLPPPPMLSSVQGSGSHGSQNSDHRFDRRGAKAASGQIQNRELPVKKTDKRKDRAASKELFKPIVTDEPSCPTPVSVKKVATMKDVVKMKAFNKSQDNGDRGPDSVKLTDKISVGNTFTKSSVSTKSPTPVLKPKVQQKQGRSEKSVLTSSPSLVPSSSVASGLSINSQFGHSQSNSNSALNQTQSSSHQLPLVEGKLSSEPDKLKLNIFKKISKVKEEKPEKSDRNKVKEEISIITRQESRESSPVLIIDESDIKPGSSLNHQESSRSQNINAMPISAPLNLVHEMTKNSPHMEKDFMYDDMSPPGTPSTPKTPEMISQHSPPIKTEKRKKKEKSSKTKNKSKQAKYNNTTLYDLCSMREPLEFDRPKTPSPHEPLIASAIKEELDNRALSTAAVFPFFPPLTGGPGLIPAPMSNPLFPRLPLNVGLTKHSFGQPPHMPTMPILPFVPAVMCPGANKMHHTTSSEDHVPLPGTGSNVEDRASINQEHIDKSSTHGNQATNSPAVKAEKTTFVNAPPVKEKHKKDKKDKIKKKSKKDKIKNKSEKRKLKEEKKEKKEEKEKIKKEKRDKKKEKEREHEGSVPKLTLKIGSPRPPTPDMQTARKIMIKPVVKKDHSTQDHGSQNYQVGGESTGEAASAASGGTASGCSGPEENREPSPELARFSALITRPPKLKASTAAVIDKTQRPYISKAMKGTDPGSVFDPTACTSPGSSPGSKTSFNPIPNFHAKLKKNMFRAVPKIKCRDLKKLNDTGSLDVTSTDVHVPVPTAVHVSAPAAFYFDNDGNKVWICPACGGQDDGSPMIGCDDCDAWYHWVCVGIQVPPDDSEDWYCRICIVKKQETLQIDKKKKRKKRERKEH